MPDHGALPRPKKGRLKTAVAAKIDIPGLDNQKKNKKGRQIKKGEMATVIGIFEDHFKKNKPLPIVKPGTQTRRFTHIEDTVAVCFEAWKRNKCAYYSISNKKEFSIKEVAKIFKSKITYLPHRKGERYASALTNISYNKKIIKRY